MAQGLIGKTLRGATSADIPCIVQLGMEALERDPYPGLAISESKVKAATIECVSKNSNFAWVVEKDGEIVAAVCATVHEMLFHERQQATVLQFYSVDPGQGVKLIRKFLEWSRNRPVIKMIVFTLECHAAPRIGKLLKRLGVDSELPVYMEVR